MRLLHLIKEITTGLGDAIRNASRHDTQLERLCKAMPVQIADAELVLPPGLDLESERALIDLHRQKYGDNILVLRVVEYEE